MNNETQQEVPQGSSSNQPKLKLRVSSFSSTVWENNQKEDTTKKYNSITLSKGFKKQGSEDWEHQDISLFTDDIPKVIALLQETYKQLNLKEE